MANIGTLALKIVASPAALVTGLAAMRQRIASWSSWVSSTLAKTGFGAAGAGLGAGLVGVFSQVGNAIAAGFGGNAAFVSDMKDKLDELFKIGMKAKTLGLASEEFMGLSANMKRFGLEADDLYTILVKFGSKIAGKGVLGIDAETLASTDSIGQLKLVADKIAEMPTVAEQSAAALELFGKKGAQVLPILQQGSKGISDYTEKMKGLGVALTQSDMAKLIEAKTTLPKLKLAFEGFGNRMLVSFAPVLTQISNIVNMLTSGLGPTLNVIGQAVAAFFEVSAQFWEEMGNAIRMGIDMLAEWLGGWDSLTRKMPTVRDAVINSMHFIAIGIAYVWDSLKAGAGAISYITSYLVKAFGWVLDTFKSVIKNLLGLLANLPEQLGGKVFAKAFVGVDKWGEKLRGVGDAMKGWGEGTWSAFGDSVEVVDQFFDRVRNRANGVQQEIKKTGAMARAEYQQNPAALFGSKEAYSIESRFKVRGLTDAAAVQRQQLEEQRRGNDFLKAIKGGIDRLGNEPSETVGVV